jgi:hypothetical protein
MQIKFHHCGFAEFIAAWQVSNKQQPMFLSISYDDNEEVYSLEIHDDSNQLVEWFNYLDKDEVIQDIYEAEKIHNK